jgi:hypothetical protein
MKLKPIASNMTEIETAGGISVLFSYSTPVACHIQGEGYYRTDKHHSGPIRRQINKWLAINGGTAYKGTKPQAYFDGMVISAGDLIEAASGEDLETVLADARLIAAAPAMLGALQQILREFPEDGPYTNGQDAVMRAIARAEGK